MSCKLQTKAINKLKEDGVLSEKLEILDLKEFDRLNELYTDTAISKYGLVTDVNLFEINKREIKLPFGSSFSRDNIKILYRAVPNNDLFIELEKLVENENLYKLESIDYKLKSIDILSSDKAKQIFTKGNKVGWDLNKILTELQVPKEQKQIILDKNITNREEIITALLADNSFVVEVNTSTKNLGSSGERFNLNNDVYATRLDQGEFSYEDMEYTSSELVYTKNNNIIPKEEYYKAKEKYSNTQIPTQYYSNLTVPGGTNYTENEIATPAITPNIKGHAQFSTSNGIGWFRSDETSFRLDNSLYDETELTNKIIKHIENPMESKTGYIFIFPDNSPAIRSNNKEEHIQKLKNLLKEVESNKNYPKTRRILEVQSDLFQKGRDKENLVKKITGQEETFESNDQFFVNGLNYYSDSLDGETITYFKGNDIEISYEEFRKAELESKKEVRGDVKQNQFLQLLNKDNNWVTFFIKSIVQDSVKKGYEKVLFPTGETAAKIEGHETIADEIIKIDKELNFDYKIQWDNKTGNYYYNTVNGGSRIFESKEEAEDYLIENKKELKLKKQELKTQGLEKLKPVEAFYTNRVTNILNKLYSISEVIDEYGNTWTEVNLIAEKLKGKDFEILLKEQNDNKTGSEQDYNYLYNNPTSKAKDSYKEELTLDQINSNLSIIRDKLFGGNLTNTTANQILRNALANLDLNDTTKELVKSLLTTRATVKFTQNLANKDTLGQYNALNRTIQLDRRRLGFLNEYATFETILHEIIHDFTVSSINNPKNDLQRNFRNEMTDLYEYYKTRSDSQFDHYGFTNVHEFMAEIIANPVFRNHIDSLSLNNKGSMLKQIWEYIKNLLGISNKKNSTDIVNSILEFVNEKEDFNSPLKSDYVFQKRPDQPKYSDKFTEELTSMNDILKKIISDINSVSSRSAAVRGKDDETSKRFVEVQKLIEKFADISANEAVYKFIQFADSELHKLNQSLLNKLSKGPLSADYLYRSKAYLAIYDSLDDIKNTLENQYSKNLIDKDEYDRLIKELNSAKSSYESFNNRHLNEAKEILTERLAPFNTRPIDKRRQELEREYKAINPGKVDKSVRKQWINDKLDSEISELMILQNEEVRRLMDQIPLDLQNMEALLTSEKNMNNLLLKLYSFSIDKVELEIRKHALSIRKQSFEALKAYNPIGINNEEKYKNLISTDSNGNHYFVSKYKPEFLTERKKLSDKADKAFEEYGKSSTEYKEAAKELKTWTKNNTIEDENGFLIGPSDKWLDPKFSKLQGKDLDYHKFIISQIKDSDVKTLGYKSLIINYMGAEFIKLPSIRKSDLDRMMSGDIKGIVTDKIADFYKPTQDTTTMGELEDVEKPSSNEFVKALTTVNNEERFLVPIHFRNKIKPNTQSLDIPTIILMNSVMSEEFRGKHSLEAESQLLLDVVGQSSVLKTQSVSRKFMVSAFSKDMSDPDFIRISGIDSNIYKKLKNVIENRVYNILDASNNKVSKDNLTVIAKSLMGYTAHLNLAVNYLSAIPNMFQGKFQNFIEGVGGSTYSTKDIKWAEAKYWNEMTVNGGLNDIGSPINNNKLNLVIDYLDVMTEFNMKKHDFEKNNKFKALLNTGTLHAFNSMGEHYIQSTLMLSVMSNIKVLDKDGDYIDSNGNKTKDIKLGMNLYDSIQIKDGVVEFHPNVVTTSFNPDQKLSENGLVQIQNLIRKKVIDLHGQYDSKIQSTIQRYWFGKAITMFRKYLLPGFYKRWRGMYHFKTDSKDLKPNQEYYSLETRQFEEGTYTTLVRFMTKTVLRGIRELKLEIMKSDWDKLTDYEKSNIHKTIRELALTGLMFVSSMMVALAAKDEDDEEMRNLLFTFAYIFRRQESELMQYYSPSDTLKIFRTPFVALSTLEKTANLFNQLMPWNISEEYTTGDRKGQYKAWIKTKKLIPVISQTERSAENSFNYLQNLLTY